MPKTAWRQRQSFDSKNHPEQANPFYTKIDNFLLGKMSEQDLLAAADSVEEKKRPEQQSEACYYVTLKRLLNGDRAGSALKLFRKQSPPAKRPLTSTILLKRN